MESLLVVTGPPGSGKSTLAAVVAARSPRSVLVEGDAFFGFLAEGSIPPWLPESNEQNRLVTEACGLAAGRFTTGGYDTVFDEEIDDRHLLDSGAMTPDEFADVAATRRANEGLRVRR